MVTSIFFFSNNVFKWLVIQGCQNWRLCGGCVKILSLNLTVPCLDVTLSKTHIAYENYFLIGTMTSYNGLRKMEFPITKQPPYYSNFKIFAISLFLLGGKKNVYIFVVKIGTCTCILQVSLILDNEI